MEPCQGPQVGAATGDSVGSYYEGKEEVAIIELCRPLWYNK